MLRPRGILFLSLCLAAFALRVFRLDYQSLWYDEAFSVFLARLNLGDITARTAADIQPPLYYYLLHFWMALTGSSEFALRFLSLWFGVLTLPLLYVVARRLFNRTAAILCTLLGMISPLYLWYSQETRMYTLLTLLGLLSSYCLLRALEARQGAEISSWRPVDPFAIRGATGWWTGFAAANIAAVYTHYFAFVIIAFQFLYALSRLLTRRRTSLDSRAQPTTRPVLLSFGAIVIAFLPWLPFLVARLGEDASYWPGALKLDEAVRHIFINFTTGESVLEDIALNLAGALILVLLVGLAAWFATASVAAKGPRARSEKMRADGDGVGFAVLYLLIPLTLLLVLFYRNPKFNARYLMIASPGFLLLLSGVLAGLVSLARRGPLVARGLAGALLLCAASLSLGTSAYADSNAFFDPAFTKPDFRGVAQYLALHAHDDEAVVLTSGHMFPAFDYYFRAANLPELRLPDDPTLNAEHVLNYEAANALNRGVAGKRGAWLVEWQDEVTDPNGFVPLLLASRGTEDRVEAAFWHVTLRHWTLPVDAKPFAAQPEVAHARAANFKNKFGLLGWSAEQPTPADQGATFTLYWQALDQVKDDYNVALRIVDAQGNLWGKLDRRPAGYNYPTTRWKKGENLFGTFSVPLLPGTPAGEYYATVTFFTASDQTGLDVLAANGAPIGRSVRIGPITVLPSEKQPQILDLKIQHTLEARAGPLTLLGYALPRDKASTGESIPLTLFWRADEKPDADYWFQVEFGGGFTGPHKLAGAISPTSQWRQGEIVRGQYIVQVPPDASIGSVNLKLGMSDGQLIELLQPFTVDATDRVFTKPGSEFAQNANFSNLIALAGYDLSANEIKPGETLTVTLIWQASAKPDKAYTVFVHLLDKDDKCCAAQKDSQPLNGSRATPTWVEGEYLIDAYALQVKPDAAAGEYHLEIGWYDGADPAFARLQVIDTNGGGAGDSVVLDRKISVMQ